MIHFTLYHWGGSPKRKFRFNIDNDVYFKLSIGIFDYTFHFYGD